MPTVEDHPEQPVAGADDAVDPVVAEVVDREPDLAQHLARLGLARAIVVRGAGRGRPGSAALAGAGRSRARRWARSPASPSAGGSTSASLSAIVEPDRLERVVERVAGDRVVRLRGDDHLLDPVQRPQQARSSPVASAHRKAGGRSSPRVELGPMLGEARLRLGEHRRVLRLRAPESVGSVGLRELLVPRPELRVAIAEAVPDPRLRAPRDEQTSRPRNARAASGGERDRDAVVDGREPDVDRLAQPHRAAR